MRNFFFSKTFFETFFYELPYKKFLSEKLPFKKFLSKKNHSKQISFFRNNYYSKKVHSQKIGFEKKVSFELGQLVLHEFKVVPISNIKIKIETLWTIFIWHTRRIGIYSGEYLYNMFIELFVFPCDMCNNYKNIL